MEIILNYSLITLIIMILSFFFKASIISSYRKTVKFVKNLVPSLNFVYV